MAEGTQGVQGLLLCDDLIFSSRVRGTARAGGLQVQTARTVDALVDLAAQTHPRAVIVDLGFTGLQLESLLGRLREATPVMPRVVAYGSHVDTATLRAARAAGCDPVLARSRFVEELAQELPKWLAGE